jgi:preprotein translocase subunit SecY
MSIKYHDNRKMNTELIVSLVIVMVTILGSTIPLYLHTSSQLQAIQDEIRDFHGRLCIIEERNKPH